MLRVPELHSCIHERLSNKANVEGVIKRSELMTLLGRIFHIPKRSKRKVIREMAEYGLLRELDKFKILII